MFLFVPVVGDIVNLAVCHEIMGLGSFWKETNDSMKWLVDFIALAILNPHQLPILQISTIFSASEFYSSPQNKIHSFV